MEFFRQDYQLTVNNLDMTEYDDVFKQRESQRQALGWRRHSLKFTALLGMTAVFFFAMVIPTVKQITVEEAESDEIVEMPETFLQASDLAIIINTNDPVSVEVGAYYQAHRGIPEENVIEVKVPVVDTLSPEQFKPIYRQIWQNTPRSVQAYAITWLKPYRVSKMSITSAIALGYDSQYSSQSDKCRRTKPSPLFEKPSILFRTVPQIFGTAYADFGVRPTMAITGYHKDQVINLINKGKSSDGTNPLATAYLMRTTDKTRSVRYFQHLQIAKSWKKDKTTLKIEYIDNSNKKAKNTIKHKKDVMFYLQGLTHVPDLKTLYFLPGALADHLTSLGGVLLGSNQMSILEFIKFGATASYGTVVEPCNYTDKFPDSRLLIDQYYRGKTAIEAYWLSVVTPGEGIFVGDPLARPFGQPEFKIQNGVLKIGTSSLDPKVRYVLEIAESPESEFVVAKTIEIPQTIFHEIVVESYDPQKRYRIRAECDRTQTYDDLKNCTSNAARKSK